MISKSKKHLLLLSTFLAFLMCVISFYTPTTAFAIDENDSTIQDYVLFEIFSSTTCQGCANVNDDLTTFLSSKDNIATIKYMCNEDLTQDYVTTKLDYYDISTIPSTVVNGEFVDYLSTMEDSTLTYVETVEEKYNEVKDNTPDITFEDVVLEINEASTDEYNQYSIEIYLDAFTIDATNLVINVALTESDIDYTWETDASITNNDYVFRKNIFNDEGISLYYDEENSIRSVKSTFGIDDDYVKQNLNLVIYIQDTSTGEIAGATIIGGKDYFGYTDVSNSLTTEQLLILAIIILCLFSLLALTISIVALVIIKKNGSTLHIKQPKKKNQKQTLNESDDSLKQSNKPIENQIDMNTLIKQKFTDEQSAIQTKLDEPPKA